MIDNTPNREKLEDEILAFFDGSLDDASSERLMEVVDGDVEARTLFESHRSLQDLITSARVSIETPEETTRSLAEKIPNLLVFLPHLVGGLETLPVLTQSANTFMTFLAKVPASMMISAGAAVTVMTAAGVYIATNHANEAKHVAPSANVQVMANPPKVANPMNLALPDNNTPATDIGHADATFNGQNKAVSPEAPKANTSATEHAAHIREIANLPEAPKANAPTSGHATHVREIATLPAAAVGGGNIKIANATLKSESPGSMKVENTAGGNHPAAVIPVQNGQEAHVTPSSNAPVASNIENQGHASAPVPEQAIAPIAPRSEASTAEYKHASSSAAHILTIDEEGSSDGSGFKVAGFAMTGARILMLPRFAETPVPGQPASEQGTSRVYSDNFAGLDFSFSNRFALRAGFGTGRIGHVTQFVVEQDIAGTQLKKFTSGTRVEVIPSQFGKLLGSFTLNPFDQLRFTVDGGGGITVAPGSSWVADLGVRGAYDVLPNVTLTAGIAYEGSWIGMGPQLNWQSLPNLTPEKTIYDDRSLNVQTLFYSSLVPSIGFSIHY